MSVAKRWGLDANTMSWVFITSLAHSAEVTTMKETSPSCRCIKGPYILATSLNFRCGVEVTARWGMFPIMGSFHGPGGSRFVVESSFLKWSLSFSATINDRRKKVKTRDNKSGIWGAMEIYIEQCVQWDGLTNTGVGAENSNPMHACFIDIIWSINERVSFECLCCFCHFVAMNLVSIV